MKKKTGKIPITNNIADRPKEANERVETISTDRGKEFAELGAVTKHLGGKQFYFPLSHHPWQRGTNENTNGLLREYFSKRKDITKYSDEYIAAVTDKINKRQKNVLVTKHLSRSIIQKRCI